MTPQDKIQQAKMLLILQAPFYASIMLNLNIKEDPDTMAAYTDGVNLGYNPKYIESLSIKEVKALIAHEVLHVALEHMFRMGIRGHELWNIACDYAVNLILKDDGYNIPEGGLISNQFGGMAAEQIYAILAQNKDGKETSTSTCTNSNNGNGGEDNGRDMSNIPPSMVGEVREYPKFKDNGEPAKPIEEAQAEWRQKVAQAMEMAKMQGRISSLLKKIITENLKPVIPWQSTLSRFMAENTKNDYTWTRPSKRYLYTGCYLPDRNTPSLGRIVVAIDTSGSITQAGLNEYAAELRAILNISPDTEIEVIYADANVVNTEVLSVYDLELHPQGGGGTDYAPVFNYVKEQGNDISCLIYFTDGYCDSFPTDKPEYPTLWVINSGYTFNPPFGEIIYAKR